MSDQRAAFDRCWPYLARSFELFPTHDKEDMWQAIAFGHAVFWPLPNAAAVTIIRVYPKCKVFDLWVAGGDLRELKSLAPHMRALAKANECRFAVAIGRPGWARWMTSESRRSLTMNIEEIV